MFFFNLNNGFPVFVIQFHNDFVICISFAEDEAMNVYRISARTEDINELKSTLNSGK